MKVMNKLRPDDVTSPGVPLPQYDPFSGALALVPS